MSNPPQFFLEKPEQPTRFELSQSSIADYKDLLLSANNPTYLYWDMFRHKVGDNKSLKQEELWFLVKQFRNMGFEATPIQDNFGNFFKFFSTPSIEQRIREVDFLAVGTFFISSEVPVNSKEFFITRGLVEEAISSSQLEGAHTSRAAARKLLIEGMEPQNESERMIVNNYKAMLAINEEYKKRPLSEELLFELHSILTKNTLEVDDQGRFRKDKDNIVVQGNIGSETFTTHIPPGELFLRTEISSLIRYANDVQKKWYEHPLIKAILLHFWIGYLHPFVDGNGRLARAVFYWYLLRHDYWIFNYIPLSTVLKKSPMQYAMAYIYAEQDDSDATYFIDYQLRKIVQAVQEFKDYVENRIEKNNETSRQRVVFAHHLNERQQGLLLYFLSNKNASATTSSHAVLYRISRQTAAKDLSYLQKLGLLRSKRVGKFIRFYAGKKLHAVNTAS